MGRKELTSMAAAGTLAIAELLTPTSAVAENSDIKPVEPQVLNAAINCIINAKPGKTIKLAQDYPGMKGQRRIVLVYNGMRYTADVSKSYPKSFTRRYFGVIEFTYEPYLQIMKRPNGTGGEDKLSSYIDGNSSPSKMQKIYSSLYPNNPAKIEAEQQLSDFNKDEKLDGIVDYAQLPQNKSKVENFRKKTKNVSRSLPKSCI